MNMGIGYPRLGEAGEHRANGAGHEVVYSLVPRA
jgi:hypothetical protein